MPSSSGGPKKYYQEPCFRRHERFRAEFLLRILQFTLEDSYEIIERTEEETEEEEEEDQERPVRTSS